MKHLQEICNFSYKILQGSLDINISALVYHSKKVVKNSLFVCLQGARFDSHNAIEEVVELGAIAIVVERECEYPKGITVIKVESSRKALALLSAAWFENPIRKMVSIGVTGTKGKTTTTYMIKTLLESAGKKVGMIGTNGIIIGNTRIPSLNTTPESYELHEYFQKMVKEGCEYVIMEVSSQGTKMHRTYGIDFDYAIFNNISPDHIGPNEHKDFTEYLECKALLFEQCKKAFINKDDKYANYMIEISKKGNREVFCFGKDGEYGFEDISYVANKDFVGLEFKTIGKLHLIVYAGIPGYFNVYNALASVGVCHQIGISKEILSDGLKHLHVDGRMEIAYKSDKFTVIIDYAHNGVSMESLLDTLRDYQPKRIVVVFGCGGNRSKDRRYHMGEIAGKKADFSIITADNSRFEKVEDIMSDICSYLEPTGGKFIRIADRREAIYYAISHAKEGDMIAIIGKGHEDYQEINGVRMHFLDREVVQDAIQIYWNKEL